MSNFVPIYYLRHISKPITYDSIGAVGEFPKCHDKEESVYAYIRKDLIETVDVDQEETEHTRRSFVVRLSNGQTYHNVMDTSTELFEYVIHGEERIDLNTEVASSSRQK